MPDVSTSSFFATHPVFTRDEFADSHSGTSRALVSRAVDKALSYHVGQGHLVRVRQRLYAVVPPGQSADECAIDALLVASRLAPDAVLGYHTALAAHGLAQSVLRRHTACTQHEVRRTVFRGDTYEGVAFPRALRQAGATHRQVMTMNRLGLDLRVTDVERTVVDVLDRLHDSGGWEEVMRSLEHVRVLDAASAAAYALVLGRASTLAKLGLFLDAHREALFVEDPVLDELRAGLPKRIYRVERGHAGPFRSVPRWRLSVPAALFDPAWEPLR
jgi:predicted transcriptional regulator of viral defense system